MHSKKLSPSDRRIAKVKPNLRLSTVQNSDDGYADTHNQNELALSVRNPNPRQLLASSGRFKSPPVTTRQFDSGLNTEFLQITRQLWTVHEEAVEFLGKIQSDLTQCRSTLDNCYQSRRFSDGVLSAPPPKSTPLDSKAGYLADFINSGFQGHTSVTSFALSLGELGRYLKTLTDNIVHVEVQFKSLSFHQAQCKLVLYVKALHARKSVFHDNYSVLQTTNQLIFTLIYIVSCWCPINNSEQTKEILVSIFRLSEVYNECLQSSYSTFVPDRNNKESDSVTIPSKSNPGYNDTSLTGKVTGIIQNDQPFVKHTFKPITALKILHLFIHKRISRATAGFIEILYHQLFKNYSPNLPLNNLDGAKFETCIKHEEVYLGPLATGFCETPSLLIQDYTESEIQNGKLIGSIPLKISSHYRQLLWNGVGEVSTDFLLWGFHSQPLPFVLLPFPIIQVAGEALAKGSKGNDFSCLSSTLEFISGSILSFSLFQNWDQNFMSCFQMIAKIKRPEQLQVLHKPASLEWGTSIGRKFAKIFTNSVTLLESFYSVHSHPVSTMDLAALSNNSKLNGSEVFGDDAQIVFRLQAALNYYVFWIVKRSKVWLNSWALPQFLALGQRDSKYLWQLIRSLEPKFQSNMQYARCGTTSIQYTAQQKQDCIRQFKAAVNSLYVKSMPDVLIKDIEPICQTLGLATLQSYMPHPKYWQGIGARSGLNAEKSSPYVRIYIERVIEPVMSAAIEYLEPTTQLAVGKHAVQAACEAWLDHILKRKIRFSEWGAAQLLRDFVALREWIRSEMNLAEDSRKGILELEILKQTEGVAFLLLRTRDEFLDCSPAPLDTSLGENNIAPEMYVTNQQMWLNLRIRPITFSISSCC